MIAASMIGAFFVVVSAVASWTWSQVMDTDNFVSTMAVVIEQPEVRDEIAASIVTSVVGDADVPAPVVALLTDGARLAVASQEFARYWELANRSLHETLRRQIVSDAPIETLVARIDLTAEVDAVLERIGGIDPQLAAVLPERAPETTIEIADTGRLDDIRGAVSGLDRLADTTPWVAGVFLVVATLFSGLRRRALRVPAIALVLTGPVIYAIGWAVPWVVRRLVDDRFDAPADAVTRHMTASLGGRAWQVLFVGLVLFVVALVPAGLFARGDRED